MPKVLTILCTVLLATAPLLGQGTQPLAIRGVDVLDLDTESLARDRTLIVRAGRIEAVAAPGEITPPAGAFAIDGRGLVAVPGLHDMHVHVESGAFAAALGLSATTAIDHEAALVAYLANGITTIQVCSGAPDLLELRDAIAAGEIVGPRLVVGSPMLAGDPPILPPPVTRVAPTADEAVSAVRELHEQGYDFVKLRENVPADAFFALVAEARQLGVRVAGHVPRGEGLSLEGVLATGSYGVLHLDELIGPEPHTEDRIEAIASLVQKHGGEVVTTLTVMANLVDKLNDYDATLAQPEMRYMHPLLKGLWLNNPFREPATPERRAQLEAWLANEERLLVALVERGATVLAGTDALNPTIVPGFSLHGELNLMVDAGLSPAQALRAATVIPARFLAGSERAGRIEAGAPADFVLVGRSPL
ncbi:MAG: amidohydrolase family protein, partial [Thermoanaerobaculia bacterium]|nr:amidohydrolase family protein [Thermoanaerobaculia bacterium]